MPLPIVLFRILSTGRRRSASVLALRRWAPAVVVGVAAAVVAACAVLLGLLLADPDMGERHTSGVEPRLRYDSAGLDVLDDGASLPIAHNSGASLTGVRAALAHGARAIEIDVAYIGGRLYAAHDNPHPLLGARFTRRPTLGAVWAATADADLLVLDLKSSSAGFVAALGEFLDEHDERPAIGVTRHLATARRLVETVPALPVLLSVADDDRLDAALADDDRLDAALADDDRLDAALADDVTSLAGLSVRHDLLDGDLVAAATDRDWVVLAWTVDDPARFVELAGWGVAAVSTDNLAIVEAVAGLPELAAPLTTLLQ